MVTRALSSAAATSVSVPTAPAARAWVMLAYPTGWFGSGTVIVNTTLVRFSAGGRGDGRGPILVYTSRLGQRLGVGVPAGGAPGRGRRPGGAAGGRGRAPGNRGRCRAVQWGASAARAAGRPTQGTVLTNA